MRNSLRLAACTAVLLVIGALEAASDADRPPEDSIRIVEVDPPVGSRLARGESVTFVVEVEYELNSDDRGRLVLSVTDEDRYNLTPSPLPLVEVKGGSGSKELTLSLQVPEYASALEITAALFRGRRKEGHTRSSAADRVTFDVS